MLKKFLLYICKYKKDMNKHVGICIILATYNVSYI